jgi:hypothetical protein
MINRCILILAALALAASVAGCGIPQDGRYQTHGGGWDNFRAEAPQRLMVGAS